MRKVLLYWVILACGTLSAGCGRGRIGLVLGAGEEIDYVLDVHEDHAPMLQEVVEAPPTNPAIGFHYEYFSLFFIEVWTWQGQYVLYDYDDPTFYWELDDEMLRALAGGTADELGTPFLYKLPPGALIIGLLIGFVAFRTVRRMRAIRV